MLFCVLPCHHLKTHSRFQTAAAAATTISPTSYCPRRRRSTTLAFPTQQQQQPSHTICCHASPSSSSYQQPQMMIRGGSMRRIVLLVLVVGCWYAAATDTSCQSEWIPPDEEEEMDFRPRGAVDEHERCMPVKKKTTQEQFPSTKVLEYLSESPSTHTFVMLNGANQGVRMTYTADCLGTLAINALYSLTGIYDDRNSLYLYSATGLPIRNAADDVQSRAKNVLYLLQEGQTWIHPFYSVGFQFSVGGFSLITVSDKPRVFTIKNFTSSEIASEVVAQYSAKLDPSPEKHYSKGYENHRTSLTGWMSSKTDPKALKFRNDIRKITRLPYPSFVEEPQFLKYDVGKWYRPHHDYFHHWQQNSQFEARRFVRARIIYLVEHVKSNKDVKAVELAHALIKVIDIKTLRDESPMLAPQTPKSPVLRSVLALSHPLPRYVLLEMCAAAKHSCDDELMLGTAVVGNLEGMHQLTNALARRVIQEINVVDKDLTKYLVFDATLGDKINIIQQNRHATLLPYLNNVEEGGETVLPNAINAQAWLGKDYQYPIRPGMRECSQGLVLSPQIGAASLFYHRLPNGELDVKSLHGGCPPQHGIKYAINGFTWNFDNVAAMQMFYH